MPGETPRAVGGGTSLRACPNCGRRQPESLAECGGCHILFREWGAAATEHPEPVNPGAAGRAVWVVACLVLMAAAQTYRRALPERERAAGAAAEDGTSDGQTARGFWGAFTGGMLGDRGDSRSRASDEYHAFGMLMDYAAAQRAFVDERRDEGRFGTLKDLVGAAPAPLLPPVHYAAWEGHPAATPRHGYLLSELDEGPDGSPLDPAAGAGIAAFPAPPGRGGSLLFLALVEPSPETGAPVARYYMAAAEAFPAPHRRWPSPEALASLFRPVDERAPLKSLSADRRAALNASRLR
jgi:hypothetical protein